jgi:imidazoleglycerol-phosphate dehydratase/histidinol-phosphatase
MKRALFISDRSLMKPGAGSQSCPEFRKAVFRSLYHIRRNMEYDLVLVSTAAIAPEVLLTAFANEGIDFGGIVNAAPGKSITGNDLNRAGRFDLSASFLILTKEQDSRFEIADLIRTIELEPYESKMIKPVPAEDKDEWVRTAEAVSLDIRTAFRERVTNESSITVKIDLDGSGVAKINTGIGFFDHLLSQLSRHSGIDLDINASGDLEVDEHHTIEDTALTLGEAFYAALGSKRGMERYGFALPMDDCMARALVDFGGRPWLVWDVEFKREKIGDMPTEMFMHFFKSFSDAAKCNLT